MNEDEIDPTKEKLYLTEEVAAMFSVSIQTIKTWVKLGKLRCNKIGGRLYYTDKQINDYANRRWGNP